MTRSATRSSSRLRRSRASASRHGCYELLAVSREKTYKSSRTCATDARDVPLCGAVAGLTVGRCPSTCQASVSDRGRCVHHLRYQRRCTLTTVPPAGKALRQKNHARMTTTRCVRRRRFAENAQRVGDNAEVRGARLARRARHICMDSRSDRHQEASHVTFVLVTTSCVGWSAVSRVLHAGPSEPSRRR